MFSSSNGNENNGFFAVERQEELETVNGGAPLNPGPTGLFWLLLNILAGATVKKTK